VIYHIAYAADWTQAQESGRYRMSTRGKTLEQQGFIHASTATQVVTVADANYLGEAGLLVLVIDESRVESAIVYESVPDSDDPFPHIYGPLNVDAVVGTLPFAPGPDGRFAFTAEG
jgi:uncharacterized protein (DUF952 family)